MYIAQIFKFLIQICYKIIFLTQIVRLWYNEAVKIEWRILMIEITLNSLEETQALGEKIASFLFEGSLLTLAGDLGAGKTTLTKSIGKALGVKKTINSPTFTILKTYYGRCPLYHIDAYRLEGMTQDLGFEEVFEDDGVCIVEWPHFIDSILPEERLQITLLRMDQEVRLAKIEGIGERYREMEMSLK